MEVYVTISYIFTNPKNQIYKLKRYGEINQSKKVKGGKV